MPSSPDEIQILISGCLDNNRRAQEQLYKRFYQALMALCVRYTKGLDDAKLVLNDGFLKVFKNLGQYDASKASLYTWMRKIIINTAIDFLRRREAVHVPDMSITGGMEEPGIDNAAIQKMNGEELLAIIRQLPPATQLVFNLYAIDGFNHREIGELLQIGEATSRWHLSEARRQLKIIIHRMEAKP